MIDRTTYYAWPETYRMIRELQPQCLIWNDGEVTWPMLHYGLEDGDAWEGEQIQNLDQLKKGALVHVRVKAVYLNGVRLKGTSISYEDIRDGADLLFVMDSR